MSHDICLSDEDLSLVRRALERELESSRLEHRHTTNLSYRDKVQQHVHELERLLHVTFSGEQVAVHA
jgi:hypothetical protein